jgi:alkylated DNA repair dioxygenase AlkB
MRQQELFDHQESQQVDVPGFRLVPDYITPGEEMDLLAQIDAQPWESDFRRRIQQYGLGYASELGRSPEWLRELPDFLIPLAERVARDAAFVRFPENCVINEYIPPLGIGAHRDYPSFGPTIACVSLGSDILTDFIQPKAGLRVSVHVPARSLWVITGPARSEWQHGIATRLNDVIDGVRVRRGRRVSITFRTAKHPGAIPARNLPAHSRFDPA